MIVRNYLKAHLTESVLLGLCVAMAVAVTCALASLAGGYVTRVTRELGRATLRTLKVRIGVESSTQAAVVPAGPATLPVVEALESLDIDEILVACPTVGWGWWEIQDIVDVDAADPQADPPIVKKVLTRAVTPGFFPAYGLTAARGSLFSQDDHDRGRRVAVLGADLAGRFFADGEPLGRSVLVGGELYRIVGVLERDPLDQDPDGVNQVLYAPPVSTRVIAGSGGNVTVTKRLPGLLFAVDDPEQLGGATLELGSYLDRALGEGAYTLVSSRDEFAADQRMFAGLLGVTAVLAALALLVAAVNILNLAGIRATRRARSVAIFRALGASVPRVFSTLAGEVLTAAVLGAALGAVASVPLARLVSRAVLDGVLRVEPLSLAIALVGSILLAVSFGVGPLYAAARRPPAQSLSAE